jgi:hypothetical protein
MYRAKAEGKGQAWMVASGLAPAPQEGEEGANII